MKGQIPGSPASVRMLLRQLLLTEEWPLPPVFVTGFLEQCWCQYMQEILDQEGDDSAAWKQAVGTLKLILWSVSPKADRAERRLLSRSIPGLVQTLRQGIRHAGYPPGKAQSFLAMLSNWHIELIRTGNTDSIEPRPENDDTAPLPLLDPNFNRFLELYNNADIEQIELSSDREGIGRHL